MTFDAALSLPTPTLSRDPCSCTLIRGKVHYAEDLCPACQAWEEGFVLVGGERRYTREEWRRVNEVEAPADVLRAYRASLKD